MYQEIKQCRICGNHHLDSILNLGMQALTGVFSWPGETVDRGPLELVKCRENEDDSCGLVQLRHSFAPVQMYGSNYGYRSGLNRAMVAHLAGIARAAKAAAPLSSGDVILDIGSNDGTLLQSMYEPGITAVGMDPTGLKFKKFYPPHIHLIPEFFSSATFFRQVGSKRAKIVSSIAMFYDLETPLQFMEQVKDVLAEDGIWIFEQSYLPAMVSQNSYDTICHEHLEYYRLKQIVWMAGRVGLEVRNIELNAANGGSFRVVAGHNVSGNQSDAVAAMLRREEEGGFSQNRVYERFNSRIERHRDELRSVIGTLRRDGQMVVGYGASTKGNVILQFCGFDSRDLPYIAEVNDDKFGRVTPGSEIPIISEMQAMELRPDVFLVLPWHFRDDFILRSQEYLSKGGAFIFPLPEIEVYRAKGASHRL